MPLYRVSQAYRRLPDGGLIAFARNVAAKMTGNAAFPTPVVSPIAITAALDTFEESVANAINGSKEQTAIKDVNRLEVLRLLRQESAYVQSLAGEDLAALLSSGFEAMSTNRVRTPLDAPVILSVTNFQTTILKLVLAPVSRAASYEVRYKTETGEWVMPGAVRSSRPIFLRGLTPGVTYIIQTRAVGGATGYSDWSDPVSHMAT